MKIEEPLKSPIKKGLSIFLAILFTITLIPTLIMIPLNQTVFNPQYFISTISKEKLVEQIPHLVVSTLQSVSAKDTSALNSSDSGSFFLLKNLDERQVNTLISSLIPPGWIDQQVDGSITSILDFLNLKTSTLQIHVDLIPLKKNLEGDAGRKAVNNLMSLFPDCTLEQMIQITKNTIESGNLSLPMCKLPINNPKIIDLFIELILPQISKSIPETITFPNGAQAQLVQKFVESPVFTVYKTLKISIIYIQIACILFGLLVVTSSFRSAKLLFSAIGIPFFISGLVVGFMALLINFVGLQLNSFAFNQLGQSGDLQLVISGTIKALVTGISTSVLIASGIAIISGLLFILISRIMKK